MRAQTTAASGEITAHAMRPICHYCCYSVNSVFSLMKLSDLQAAEGQMGTVQCCRGDWDWSQVGYYSGATLEGAV